MRVLVPCLLVLLAAAATAGAQEGFPEFGVFEISRAKVGNAITTTAKIYNRSSDDLAGARVTITFFEGDRELKSSDPVTLPKIEAGKSASFTAETKQVSRFDRFAVLLEYGGRRLLYLADSLTSPPKLQGSAKLELVSKKDTPPESFPGEAKILLTLRNDGEIEAREPTAVIDFGAEKKYVRLADGLPPETEAEYEVAIPECPRYDELKIEVTRAVGAPPNPPGEITTASRVEVGRFKFTQYKNGTLRVAGTLRNGLDKGIKNTVITFKLGEHTHPVELGDALAPGALRRFDFHVPDLAAPDGCSFNVRFEHAEGPFEPARDTTAKVKEVRSSRVERKAPEATAREPEKEEKESKSAKKRSRDKESDLRIGLAGFEWISGGYNRVTKKWGKEVGFLKLVITDADGNHCKINAEVSVSFFVEGKKQGWVKRYVKTGHWGLPGEKIDSDTAKATLVAFHKKDQELWVGLIETSAWQVEPQLDIEIEVRKAGTWKWEKLGEPWKTSPKPPDEE